MSIGTAVVGCGNFARAVHLPNLKKLSDYVLKAAADTNAEAAEAAKGFGAAYTTTDYQRVLNDPSIDLVIICTPHFQHASMALEAVNAGKHVLVEKPMATKLEEIGPLVDAVRRKGITFTVGFNRRYSFLAQKARQLLAGRKYPLLLVYRMVDEIWRHPWALDPEIGGGRIISEAVHLFDFCAYMVGAEPVRISAEGGALTHPEIPGTQDNAVMTLSFADGSIASLTIGDLGNADYPKERIELFSGERTILIDNFQRLEAYGFDEEREISLPEADKGFIQELTELANAIRDHSPAPITEIDGARATLCALKAIEAMRTGKAQALQPAEYMGSPG